MKLYLLAPLCGALLFLGALTGCGNDQPDPASMDTPAGEEVMEVETSMSTDTLETGEADVDAVDEAVDEADGGEDVEEAAADEEEPAN